MKTHFADDTIVLYHNDGKGNFDDVTRPLSGSAWRPATSAGATELWTWTTMDIRISSWLRETFIRKWSENSRSIQIRRRVSYFAISATKPSKNWWKPPAPASPTPTASRGCAFGDFDNDGDMDVLIVNLNEPPSLLRNDLKVKQNWIKVKLEGVKSNRSAIGARVLAHFEGKTQAQALLSQSSFYSCNDSRLHFGLGHAATVDLEVRWPSGTSESFKNLSANQLVTLKEGVGKVANRGWAQG